MCTLGEAGGSLDTAHDKVDIREMKNVLDYPNGPVQSHGVSSICEMETVLDYQNGPVQSHGVSTF